MPTNKELVALDFHRMILLFMDYCASKQLRPKTMQSYEKALLLFARWLQDNEEIHKAEHVKEMHIRRYILELQSRGKYTAVADEKSRKINHPENRSDCNGKVSNITINGYLRIIRVFFAWMEESECIAKSPMTRVRLLPAERKPKEYITDEEVKKLMREMDKSLFSEYRDLLVMMIMLDSGTRLGETLSIEMDQLNLVEQTICLPADKTKGRKERTVFFSQKTAKELRRWCQFKDRFCESEYLFPVRSTGRLLSNPNYEANFRKYMERAGITKHVSPHTLRNNFAKRCLMAGMDIYTLSRILGHSSVTVTEQAYLDVNDDDLKKRYSKFSPLEGIFFKKE